MTTYEEWKVKGVKCKAKLKADFGRPLKLLTDQSRRHGAGTDQQDQFVPLPMKKRMSLFCLWPRKM